MSEKNLLETHPNLSEANGEGFSVACVGGGDSFAQGIEGHQTPGHEGWGGQKQTPLPEASASHGLAPLFCKLLLQQLLLFPLLSPNCLQLTFY